MTVSFGLPPLKSLSAVSATSAVPAALDNVEARAYHSLYVVSGTGVSNGVVSLQGSNDGGVTWFTTNCTVTTNSASAAFAALLADFPFQQVRAKITTIITGGTVSAWVASA